MKRKLRNRIATIGLMLLIAMTFSVTSCRQDTSYADHTYTCPMHPTVESDRPGSCPVCGMDLVLKTGTVAEAELPDDIGGVLPSTNESVVASIRTTKGVFKSVDIALQLNGIVTYDSRQLRTISSKVGGRLEKVYLRYPYQPVRKGQKVAEIYSPELAAAQRELLFLLENDPSNEPLVGSARRKLRLLGLTEEQVAQTIRTRNAQTVFSVYSAYDGYVIVPASAPPAAPVASRPESTSMSDDMTAGTAAQGTSSPLPAKNDMTTLVQEGSYVSAGQVLFSLADKTTLRIEFQAAANALPMLRVGTPVTVQAGKGNTIKGKIDLIEPFIGENASFTTARVIIKESDLTVGQLVTATVEGKSGEGMWVPREAVVHLGIESVIFKKEKNGFVPSVVTAGMTAGNEIQIVRGLTSSDVIAANAQFLVDSESSIKTQ